VHLPISDVLRQLRSEGLVGAEADGDVRKALEGFEQDAIPWYMRVAIGFGAWVATGFLLGTFFGIADLEGDAARIAAGAALVVAAVLVRRTADAEFMRQAAVASSLAGQALILAGLSEMFESGIVVGIAGVILSVALVWAMPDRVHRFLSALIGAGSAMAFVVDLEQPGAADIMTLGIVALAGYVWRVGAPERSDAMDEMLEPVGYGLIVALLGILLVGAAFSLRDFAQEMSARLGPATTVGITIAMVALVLAVLKEHDAQRGSTLTIGAVAATLALGVATLSTPGIIAGASVLVLGFDRRNRVLIGLAAIFLVVFGSVYYYQMSLTLLEKSGVLVASGVLLLVVRWDLERRAHEDGTAR
jgi:uncharacterized membrane protein